MAPMGERPDPTNDAFVCGLCGTVIRDHDDVVIAARRVLHAGCAEAEYIDAGPAVQLAHARTMMAAAQIRAGHAS
jgi:hypothetical protein